MAVILEEKIPGPLSVAGVATFASTVVVSGQIQAQAGSAANPAYAYSGDLTSGHYLIASGSVGLATSGVLRLTVSATLITSALPVTVNANTGTGATLIDDNSNILGQRNGTNAQILRIYNTFTTLNTVYEAFEVNWQASANVCLIRTTHVGATGRNLTFAYSASSSAAINVPNVSTGQVALAGGASTSSANSAGRVTVAPSVAMTATSGTHVDLGLGSSANPTATSTLIFSAAKVTTTINYSNGTPGAGQIKLVHIAPTVTAAPTGLNAALVLSASASVLGGTQYHNQSDEATNYEIVREAFVSNVFVIRAEKGGSGTVRGISLCASGGTLSFYGATPVARAAAISAPTTPGVIYSQAEAQSMETAVNAIRTALLNVGITS